MRRKKSANEKKEFVMKKRKKNLQENCTQSLYIGHDQADRAQRTES